VADKVVLSQGFLRMLRFSSVSIIPPMLILLAHSSLTAATQS
jgi:hypothetical protein